MTREQALEEIKTELLTLDREQLLMFHAEMDVTDAQELASDAVDLVNEAFDEESMREGKYDVEDAHNDIMSAIRAVKGEL